MVIGQIFAIAFWVSLAFSTLLAILGVWREERLFLVASAILSLPFVVVTMAHPSTRYFAVVPLLHLLTAVAIKGFPRWISWAMLIIIVAVAGLFLMVLFGVI